MAKTSPTTREEHRALLHAGALLADIALMPATPHAPKIRAYYEVRLILSRYKFEIQNAVDYFNLFLVRRNNYELNWAKKEEKFERDNLK